MDTQACTYRTKEEMAAKFAASDKDEYYNEKALSFFLMLAGTTSTMAQFQETFAKFDSKLLAGLPAPVAIAYGINFFGPAERMMHVWTCVLVG